MLTALNPSTTESSTHHPFKIMESSTPPTGSAHQASTNGKPGDHFANGSPRLPLFSSARGTFQRPILSREAKATEHDHQVIRQRLRIHRHLNQQQQQRRRDTYGNLMMTAFILIAIAMAGYSIHREGQMVQQEIH